MPSGNPAIRCVDLTKRYPNGFTALDRLTLSIPAGSSFGIAGQNGAGKSTFVRLLLGFIHPTAGSLSILGMSDPYRAHHRIGYVHERQFPEVRFSARRDLSYAGSLSHLHGAVLKRRIDRVLDLVGLTAAAGEPASTYSKGMLQRLAIARALLAEPELLILDEPSSGLDPASRHEIRVLIAGLRERGRTIMLCSHDLREIESLCDSFAILAGGTLALTGSVEPAAAMQVDIELEDAVPIDSLLPVLPAELPSISVDGRSVRIHATDQDMVLRTLLDAGIAIRSLNPVRQSLEDQYLNLVGDTARGN